MPRVFFFLPQTDVSAVMQEVWSCDSNLYELTVTRESLYIDLHRFLCGWRVEAKVNPSQANTLTVSTRHP